MYDDYDDEIGYYDDLLDDIEEQEYEARIIVARKEELAAYDDFIASLDMDD